MNRSETTLPNVGDTGELCLTTMQSPVGELTLIASPRGVRAVLWPRELKEPAAIATMDGGNPAAAAILRDVVAQLQEYFDGERHEFDLPLDPVGTAFQQSAWGELRRIPYGETISYGEQARRLGDPNKSRAVGAANGRNPISIIVPCHRVVGANGSLTGFAAGVEAKAWLLHHEQGAMTLL
jgi:methylated-DNA-[protein]-cysteine S-methyltransferase